MVFVWGLAPRFNTLYNWVMLKKTQSLKLDKDFKKVFRFSSPRYLKLLKIRSIQTFEQIRIGIIVSKNISNKAVVRNRYRRQIKAILRDLLDNHDLGKKKLDVVITVYKKPDFKTSFQDFSNDLIQWQKTLS
ncbi:MAG: ribonuclease P protein component [Candidatus Berkelbacteria bacterium Licking1014_7]|uniref:Ribonuclease P protein component n=1 Tax=Candidatus Berkelbacteria bacterium Licking1014_7 TaxID=2017147 RepID=A0A554LJ58_9BACT|nr:MAG: ribonuclease P protein component [Candidatus Berkelbacteria bacterium Licking1014_7]